VFAYKTSQFDTGEWGEKKNRFLFSIFFVEHMTKCHQQASEAMRRVKGATNVCVCVYVSEGGGAAKGRVICLLKYCNRCQ